MEETRRYVIVDPGTPVFVEDGCPSTGGVLGGSVSADNAYVRAYPKVLGKPIADLALLERTRAEYRLSGSHGTYEIVRVA